KIGLNMVSRFCRGVDLSMGAIVFEARGEKFSEVIERGFVAAGRLHLDHCLQVGEQLLLPRACVSKRNHALLSLPSSIDSPSSPARNYNFPLRNNKERTRRARRRRSFCLCVREQLRRFSAQRERFGNQKKSLRVLRDLRVQSSP